MIFGKWSGTVFVVESINCSEWSMGNTFYTRNNNVILYIHSFLCVVDDKVWSYWVFLLFFKVISFKKFLLTSFIQIICFSESLIYAFILYKKQLFHTFTASSGLLMMMYEIVFFWVYFKVILMEASLAKIIFIRKFFVAKRFILFILYKRQ